MYVSVEDWAEIRRLHRAERMFGELIRRRPASSRRGLQPRQDDQVAQGADKQEDRQYIRADPDVRLSEALTGCIYE